MSQLNLKTIQTAFENQLSVKNVKHCAALICQDIAEWKADIADMGLLILILAFEENMGNSEAHRNLNETAVFPSNTYRLVRSGCPIKGASMTSATFMTLTEDCHICKGGYTCQFVPT
jgi:hypothetical protein